MFATIVGALIRSHEETEMRFNLKAFLVFVAFCVLLGLALSSGSGWFRAAEATVSVLILLSLAGVMRDRQRTP
ncbi:MAG TPA: hypothetical protein VGJ39_09190 [Vicinamibacterales bacterium]